METPAESAADSADDPERRDEARRVPPYLRFLLVAFFLVAFFLAFFLRAAMRWTPFTKPGSDLAHRRYKIRAERAFALFPRSRVVGTAASASRRARGFSN